jgi:nucleoside-diphosphate-sugar epimerase
MIGANLTHRLVSLGNRPTVLTRANSSQLRLESLGSNIQIATADLRDTEAVAAAVKASEPDIVFHLASSFFNPPTLTAQDHFDANVTGMLNLLEALKDRPGSRFIYTGSAAVYSGGPLMTEDTPMEPTTLFGASKAAGTIVGQTYARMYDIEYVELRVFQTFGPWDRARRLVPHVILQALAGEPVEIGAGTQQRDFVYIGDIVDALIEATLRPLSPGLILNIASGIGSPIRGVAEQILELMGNPVPLHINAQPTRPDEIWEISGDSTAAQTHLGWQPRTGLEDGLRKAIDWFVENRDVALKLS